MRLSAMTWVDLIAASALVLGTIVGWKAADAAVEYVLQDRAPDRDDYLEWFHVRSYELRTDAALAALTAARNKWIEARLANGVNTGTFGQRVADFEREVLNAEKSARDIRRQATDAFDDASSLFALFKTGITFAAHVVGTLLIFVLVSGTGGLAARMLKLMPNWRNAAIFACCLLAPIYGFTVAGGLGAAIGALPALLVLTRP